MFFYAVEASSGFSAVLRGAVFGLAAKQPGFGVLLVLENKTLP